MTVWFDLILWLTHAFYIVILFIQERVHHAKLTNMQSQRQPEEDVKESYIITEPGRQKHTENEDITNVANVIERTISSC